MATNSYRPNLNHLIPNTRISRSLAFGVIIVTALLFFEIFNYSTTDYALSDLLGDLEFAGIRWATILAIAFCGIDFAGIARLFAPDLGNNHNESYFLFGAWLLAATMNTMLTWWGVSLAIINRQTMGEAIVSRETILRFGPIFVAVLVWLIRVMIIGAFSVAGDRLFKANSIQGTAYTRRRPLMEMDRNLSVTSSHRPLPPQTSKSRPTKGTSTGQSSSASQPTVQNSRYSDPIPEPDYIDDEAHTYGSSNYAPVPLAARPTGQPANSGAHFEAQSSRTPIPRRRT